MLAPMSRLRLILALLALLSVALADNKDVRVLFLTDCTMYSDWQSVAWVFSYKFSGHKGPLTRVMCCEPENVAKYPKELMEIVDTHVAPSFTVHPRTHDIYAAYNKPEAVVDYLQKVTPPEDWLVVLDSDMLLRHPFKVEDYNISKGWAAGAKYTYMIGVNNPLADRHISEIPKRNDTFAGPFGRRSDQVGGFFFAHRDDMKRLSPLWLKYTEDVRADPEAWRYTGDVYAVKPGMKPWISEMYGYSYGAAKAGVWHHWDDITMLYPAYLPAGIPKVLHYGLFYEFQGYSWDKHRFFDFNVTTCPPWDLNPKENPKGGIFHPPPRLKDLKMHNYLELYKDLIAVENVVTLNAGFCDYHRKHCPPSLQLETVCKDALIRFLETRKALKIIEDIWDCVDHMPDCTHWKDAGECTKNPGFMAANCKVACNMCKAEPYAKHPDILDKIKGLEVSDAEYMEVFKSLGYEQPGGVKAAAAKQGVEGSGQQGAQFAETKSTTEAIIKVAAQPPVAQAGEAKNTAQPPPSTQPAETKQEAAKVPEKVQEKVVEVNKEEPKKQEEVKAAEVKEPVETKQEEKVEEPADSQEEVKEPADTQEEQAEQPADSQEEEGELVMEDEETPEEVEEKPVKKTKKRHHASGANRDFTDKVLKLLKRCYRQDGLTTAELKECVKAARQEKKYHVKARAAGEVGEDAEARVLLDETKDKASDADKAAGRVAGHPTAQVAANTFSPWSWQGILVWLVIVALFVTLLPRLVRRRRTRSGMRSE